MCLLQECIKHGKVCEVIVRVERVRAIGAELDFESFNAGSAYASLLPEGVGGKLDRGARVRGSAPR